MQLLFEVADLLHVLLTVDLQLLDATHFVGGWFVYVSEGGVTYTSHYMAMVYLVCFLCLFHAYLLDLLHQQV
jgi:hypothetical protein